MHKNTTHPANTPAAAPANTPAQADYLAKLAEVQAAIAAGKDAATQDAQRVLAKQGMRFVKRMLLSVQGMGTKATATPAQARAASTAIFAIVRYYVPASLCAGRFADKYNTGAFLPGGYKYTIEQAAGKLFICFSGNAMPTGLMVPINRDIWYNLPQHVVDVLHHAGFTAPAPKRFILPRSMR